ncbi:hypothetical protein V2E67_004960 [Citrobacter freundii]|nr:hypothetical protein [Citrobacter freundii]
MWALSLVAGIIFEFITFIACFRAEKHSSSVASWVSLSTAILALVFLGIAFIGWIFFTDKTYDPATQKRQPFYIKTLEAIRAIVTFLAIVGINLALIGRLSFY